MGQYWYPVNLDKKEFIHPHKLGAGLKLWEQLANHPGTGGALIVLCAAMPDARGGGDLKESPVVGRWAGDRIALVGDYAEDTDLPEGFPASEIYPACANGEYEDITDMVATVIEDELDGKFEGEDGSWKQWRDVTSVLSG